MECNLLPTDIAQQIIDEFRTHRGRVTGVLENKRILLLTTVDRETGGPRTAALEFLLDGTRRTLVVAVPDGTGPLPQWYEDVLADPRVTVENGAFTIEARAVPLPDGERDAVVDRAAALDPGLAGERSAATAPLPVVALNPVSGRPSGVTWSDNLKLIHDAFRREMSVIRSEAARSGTRLGAQLRINCLTLCGGLDHHHRSEDAQMFPVVDEHHPELADAVRRLREEHAAMAKLLEELQRVIGSDDADRAAVRAEVDRLTAAVEAHLDYEEEQLLPILDALPAG